MFRPSRFPTVVCITALAIAAGLCGCGHVRPQDHFAGGGSAPTAVDDGSGDAMLASATDTADVNHSTGDASATNDEHAAMDRFRRTFANRFSHAATWLILGGMALGVFGLLLLISLSGKCG